MDIEKRRQRVKQYMRKRRTRKHPFFTFWWPAFALGFAVVGIIIQFFLQKPLKELPKLVNGRTNVPVLHFYSIPEGYFNRQSVIASLLSSRQHYTKKVKSETERKLELPARRILKLTPPTTVMGKIDFPKIKTDVPYFQLKLPKPQEPVFKKAEHDSGEISISVSKTLQDANFRPYLPLTAPDEIGGIVTFSVELRENGTPAMIMPLTKCPPQLMLFLLSARGTTNAIGRITIRW